MFITTSLTVQRPGVLGPTPGSERCRAATSTAFPTVRLANEVWAGATHQQI